MDIFEEDIVKYKFPEPKKEGLKEVVGKIERITDTHVYMITDSQIKIKIAFRNFEHITPVKDPALYERIKFRN